MLKNAKENWEIRYSEVNSGGFLSCLFSLPEARMGGHGYSSLSVCYPRRAWAATGIVVCQSVCLFVCLSVLFNLLTWLT